MYVTYRGLSGLIYTFEWAPWPDGIPGEPGVYIVMGRTGAGLNALAPQLMPLYVGRSQDLFDRVGGGLLSHHRIDDFRAWGACALLFWRAGLLGDEADAELDLKRALNPPLNDQKLGSLCDILGAPQLGLR